MENPDVAEDDDSVELSFQELLQSSPYVCVAVGALSACLTFAVLMSLFIPTDSTRNERVHASKRKILTERGSQTGCSNMASLISDARYQHLPSSSSRRPLYEEGQEELEYAQIRHQEMYVYADLRKQHGSNRPCVSQLEHHKYPRNLSTYGGGDKARSLTSELQPDCMASNVTIHSRTPSLHQLVWDTASNKYSLSEKTLKKLEDVAPHSELNYPLSARLVDGCKTVKTNKRSITQSKQATNCNRQRKATDLNSSTLIMSRNRVGRKGMETKQTWFDRTDKQLEAVVNTEDESEEYCFPGLSPLKHKPYRMSELSYTDIFDNVYSSLPKPSRQNQPAPGVSSKRSDIELTVEPATGVLSRLSHKHMSRSDPPPCCPTLDGGIRRSDRMPQGKGKMLHKPVNTQKQRRRKKLKHSDSPRTRTQPALTKSLRYRTTSRSHSGRPPVTPSSKFNRPSIADNARLFHLDNYNHSLNSENAADDGAGRKRLQSGLCKSRSCSLHSILSPGSRVSNLAENNGLPYNHSIDDKLLANLDHCEKCYGPIIGHGSNVQRPVAPVLLSNNVTASMAESEVSSNDHSRSSHHGDATMEQRMLPPWSVIKRSMSKSPVSAARHCVQRDMLSPLNGELTTPAMYNNSQTSRLSDQGQHRHGSSEYRKTRMSKPQRKQNYIDDNGSVMTADYLWKTDAPGISQQFGNSANALLCTSPGEIHDNALSSTAGPVRKTHGAVAKQRITFRQCSAARESHQNVPTFTLRAVSSEEGHTTVSAITNKGQSNIESHIKRQFITNPSLHKSIDSKTLVSLGSCSSELKSLMRTTIIDLQKYRPGESTNIDNLPSSVEELSLESRLGGEQLVSKSIPQSRRAGSQRGKDHSNSHHPAGISVCRGHSMTCNISRRDNAPGECKQQMHGTLTGADTSVTTSHALSRRQRRKPMEQTATRNLSSSMYQSHLESCQAGRTTGTVFSRESTSKVTLKDLEDQSYYPCDCRSYIECNDSDNRRRYIECNDLDNRRRYIDCNDLDNRRRYIECNDLDNRRRYTECNDLDNRRRYIECNDIDNRRCYNHGMLPSGDKPALTYHNSRRKGPLGYRRQCSNSNIICQETFSKLETSEPLELVPTACMIRAHKRNKRLNCGTHTSVHCIKTLGAAMQPDEQKLNKGFTLMKNKSRQKTIKRRIRTVGGDDRIDQQIVCGGIPEKPRQCFNIAQTSKQFEGRCDDGEQKVSDRCDELHSLTDSGQECTQPYLSGCESVNCSASTSGSMYHLSNVSLMTNSSAECADLDRQMTFTSSHMTNSIEIQTDRRSTKDATITSIHSAMDSISCTRESEIVQEFPNGKLELSINGTGSRESDEHTLQLSTETSTLNCDGIASVETFSVSVSWNVCPSTDLQKVVNSQTSSQTSSQARLQMHKHPHQPNNLEHRIRDRNVSHESAIKCGSEDTSYLARSTKVQQDNLCSKERYQITKKRTPDKRKDKIRLTSTDHSLIGKEIIQAKRTSQSDLRTWWELPNRDPAPDYFPKERYQRHKDGIHLSTKKCALRETGLKKDSQMALRNSILQTSMESNRVSNSHILVLRSGSNYRFQNSLSSQSTSSDTSIYVAQLISDTSSLDLSDNPYRLQDALVINTDSLCRQTYQSSSSTSIATVCPSITINTDTYCCPKTYAYMSGEKALAKMRCRSVEQLDDMRPSPLNNTLQMDPLEYQSAQSINSRSNTTISNESYLTGWDGPQLPMYGEFTGAPSILARTKNIPKNSHPQEQTLFANTTLKPECGHHDMVMSMEHRHQHRYEPVRSSESYNIHHSSGTLQSSDSSNIEHSYGTMQSSDDSSIRHTYGTVQPWDDVIFKHSCGTVHSPYSCSLEHSGETEQVKDSCNSDQSCGTEETKDSYNTDRSCETLQLSDFYQHRDPALKTSQRQLAHTRKPVSCSMSPPSILLNGEHVSYMQIISKNGAFKGFRLSELNEHPFPNHLKKSHSKDADRKRVCGDSLLTVGRPPVSSSVSQIVGFDVSLESKSYASETSFDCSLTSSHSGRARLQVVEVADNSKHVVFAHPLGQIESTYPESAQETRDDLHKRRPCINRQVCKHSHGKSPAHRVHGDSHGGVISKGTQRTDFVETPKRRKEINENKLRDQNPASIQALHNMYRADQTVKNKTETSQAYHPCNKKNSKIPRIFSQNTSISKRKQGKNQEREKTRKETSGKHFNGFLMNRQEATSISKKYQTTERKERSNTLCKTVKTGRSKCNNEREQVAGVLTKGLNPEHSGLSSMGPHRRRKCRATCQQTSQRELRSLKINHKQPPNNVRKPRLQKFLQHTKCKPEANNTDLYKDENAQVSKHRVRWHKQNIADEFKTSISKYQGPCRFANVEGVQPVLGSMARKILIKQASSKAHVPKNTLSIAKKAKTRTVLCPRNLKALEEKTNNDCKKRIISQHESAKMKVPFSRTSKDCKLKAILQSKKSEHANKTRTAHTCAHPGVDDALNAIKKTTDVLLPPCKRFRKDLFQREKNTQLTTGKKSQPLEKQQTSNQDKYQSHLSLDGVDKKLTFNQLSRVSSIFPPPRLQKTILSRNIPKSVCQPGLATVCSTESSPASVSHSLLYSKLRDHKGKVGSETHCMKRSSLNSVMKYNDPKALTEINRHGSTCSPEETLSHALSGRAKVGPIYVNKQRITKPGVSNPKVSSGDDRHHKNHQQSDVALSQQMRWARRPVRNHKIPKTVLAASDIESLASLSKPTSAAPFVGLRKGPDCYLPTARNTTRKFNRFPGNIHNPVCNNGRDAQTRHGCQHSNTYHNSQYLKYRRNRSCSQAVLKHEKTLTTEDSSKGQAYKHTATKHVQFGKSKQDAESSTNMHSTRKYGVERIKHGANRNNHLMCGVDSFQNIEIFQPDTDVMCGYNLPESRSGSSPPRLFLKSANFGLSRDLVGEVLAVSRSNGVPKADKHTDSQQIHPGDKFPEDGQYAPNNYRYAPAHVSTTVSRQPNTKLVTAVSAEVIKTPESYSWDRSTSPDEQGCSIDQFHLIKATCDTPRTDFSQECAPASASEQPPVLKNALKKIAVNNSAKNVRVHCMARHLNANNDYTTEDSSMFPNTTDDVSASAVFDNNFSVTDSDYKHLTGVQKNNIRNPYQ